jgi:hypothetical protein
MFRKTSMDISTFPRQHRHTNILYKDLDLVNKSIVDKHLKLSGEVSMWKKITDWMIDQIHQKKSVKKQDNYIPTGITKYYYEKYLFRGQKSITTLDVYPSCFICYLEDILAKEIQTKQFNILSVYYGYEDKPEELRFDNFYKEEWLLSEGSAMSETDLFVMEKYKMYFIYFLDKCVDLLKEYKKIDTFNDKYYKCRNERNIIYNVMTPPYK